MSKLYIIEGPDCSGKTSLAKFICRVKPAAYFHASGAKSLHLAMLDYHLSIIESAKVTLEMGINVVLDRLWPSEYVYGQVLRSHVSDRVYDFQKVLVALEDLHPTYVWCCDDLIHTRHQEQADPDHPYDVSEFSTIVAEYRDLAEDWGCLASPICVSTQRCVNYSIIDHGNDLKKFVEENLP